MNEFTGAERVEAEHARFVLLTYSRDWPKYVVSWSLRQIAGDGDFPLNSGHVEQLPPRDATGLDALRDDLRQEALDRANAASAEIAPAAGSQGGKRSFLGRLFGKK